MTYHSLQLKKRTFDMIPKAKEEFLRFHPEMENMRLSNDKVLYEVLKFYLAVEYGRGKK